MKTTIPLIAISLLGSMLTTTALAQAVEKTVALHTVVSDAKRYVTSVSGGGLTISSRTVTSRTVYTLIDSNGGDLADGDEVHIKATDAGGGKDTYWHEEEGKVRRTDRKVAAFKIKKTDAGISLQAPSGKFLSSAQADYISVTDAPEKAVVFEVAENPTVEEATPKAAASPAASPETKK